MDNITITLSIEEAKKILADSYRTTFDIFEREYDSTVVITDAQVLVSFTLKEEQR